MADRSGDPNKQPAECNINASPPRCPHMKCTYEGWDGESYSCERCGERYKLYYEDMA